MDKPFNDNIKKNNLQLFKSGERQNSSTAKSKNKVKTFFSRMYIACQATSGDINTFFEHENHYHDYWPLSLAENNLMRFGGKSDLLKCLETLTLLQWR